jgi:hypothetical protein
MVKNAGSWRVGKRSLSDVDELEGLDPGANVELMYSPVLLDAGSRRRFTWPEGDAVIFYRAYITPWRRGQVIIVPLDLNRPPAASAGPEPDTNDLAIRLSPGPEVIAEHPNAARRARLWLSTATPLAHMVIVKRSLPDYSIDIYPLSPYEKGPHTLSAGSNESEVEIWTTEGLLRRETLDRGHTLTIGLGQSARWKRPLPEITLRVSKTRTF